jgi:hypothetical protein
MLWFAILPYGAVHCEGSQKFANVTLTGAIRACTLSVMHTFSKRAPVPFHTKELEFN